VRARQHAFCRHGIDVQTIKAGASRLNDKQWNLAKVNIQCDDLEAVLQRNGCKPDVIARNGQP
jgi:hypothetical protein